MTEATQCEAKYQKYASELFWIHSKEAKLLGKWGGEMDYKVDR